jgi:riboflavin biosynthesis pyrimidine reductase
VAEIARLKDEPGKDIVQYGFGQLSHAMLEHGLLDELRLWVHPFVIGKGGPGDLLYRDAPTARFRLADVTPLESGIVVLSYTAG